MFLKHSFAPGIGICTLLVTLLAAGNAVSQTPLRLGSGPQLFVDDYLIASQSGLSRTLGSPVRPAAPIVTGPLDGNESPYNDVLRDSATGEFRLWYNGGLWGTGTGQLYYMTSPDGITNWSRPRQTLDIAGQPIGGCGAGVVDRGANCSDPSARYAYAWWHSGVRVATSPNGVTQWTPVSSQAVIPTDHDIIELNYDPQRNQYIACCSTASNPTYPGLRIPTQSVSTDLIHWSTPAPTITPDVRDPAQTEFYGMSGIVDRGGLLVGMVKVLQNSAVAAGSPSGAYGVGYTNLCWSRDGVNWSRDAEPFIARNSVVGAWDYAMAWGDTQLVVGDQTYLYYGGYRWGHKVNATTERQIGLATIGRDRYVSRDAGTATGTLRTPAFVSDADAITINASVDGELKVRVLDENGNALPGFDWSDFAAIHGDSLSHAAHWTGDFATLSGRPIALDFSYTNGQLYGFDLALPEPSVFVLLCIGSLGILGYAWLWRK